MIEVLYFEGCPNHEPAVELAREVVRELALADEIREIQVETADEAERLRFLGSPSLRVGGSDIEPGADERSDYALACRMYGASGLPPKQLLIAALAARE